VSNKVCDLDGWEQKTTTDEPRLSELVALYEQLGFEVLLRPISEEELGEACLECYLAEPDRYRTIYTRQVDERRHTMAEGFQKQLTTEADLKNGSGNKKGRS
jgi:hypothetical protein